MSHVCGVILETVDEGLRGKLADTDPMDRREQRIPEEEMYYVYRMQQFQIFRPKYACKLFIAYVHLNTQMPCGKLSYLSGDQQHLILFYIEIIVYFEKIIKAKIPF